MLVLGLDTTLGACSAALYDSGRVEVLAHRHEAMQQGHAERLAGMVEEIAGEAGINLGDLDRIAVTIGPGTFTGVRIGLSLARGMAVALGIPVIGVSTLQAIAANMGDNRDALPVSVIMDARRGAVYTQTFSATGEPLNEAACVRLDDLGSHLVPGDHVIVGSGTTLVGDMSDKWHSGDVSPVPDSRVVAKLAAVLPVPKVSPAPIYLRPADAKQQKPLVKLERVEIDIMTASAAHRDVLSAIHAECFVKSWNGGDFEKLLATPGTTAMIASAKGGDNPGGFILIRQAADEAEIITLCVRPQMRRRGIAAQLVEQAISHLNSHGAEEIFLEVSIDNEPAQALYRSAGFDVAGRRKGYYQFDDGGRADAIIMKLAQ